MPYEPDKPWDPSLKYTYGQSCIYNGLRYIWWNFEKDSNPGIEVYKDEVMFTTSTSTPDGPIYDQRKERGWILSESINARSTAAAIRGLPPGGTVGNCYFELGQGIKFWSRSEIRFEPYVEPDPFTGLPRTFYNPVIAYNKTDESWAFYGSPDGITFSPQLRGMSTDYGLANNDVSPPFAKSDGDPFVGTYVNFKPDGFWPQGPDIESLTVEVESGVFAQAVRAFWSIEPTQFWEHGAADVLNMAIWFNRECSYTINVVFYKDYGDVGPDGEIVVKIVGTQSFSGTINSGPIRDKFSTTPTYGETHIITDRPDDATYATYDIVYNSFSPVLGN